ncbi:hypothetical protein K2X85_05690 [bacterium]|jgi:hypothetical protein|nr:hypothetical protein [bacterium]
MTLTGKILVVLNMMMGIFFMGFAMIVYETRAGLRQEMALMNNTLNKTSSDLTQSRTLLAASTEEQAKLQTEKQQEAEKYQQEIANLTNSTNTLKKELADFRTRVAKDESVASKATDNQTVRDDEITQLRKFREELIAQKSAMLKENTELKDKLQQATNDLKLTQVRNEDVVNQVSELERYIAAVRQSYKVPGPEEILTAVGAQAPPPPPDVEGIVTRVDKEGKFFQISLGEDDGLRPGQQLQVWRQKPEPKYLGTVKVTATEPTTAVVSPITLTGLIQQNDRVGPEIMPNAAAGN